jgi:inner membrane protein
LYKTKNRYKSNTNVSGKTLIINANLADNLPQSLDFNCTMKLNGSSSLNFIPIGQNTNVSVGGQWQSPSFVGSFSPESTIDNKQFNATWNILSFNREIPETWTDDNISELGSNAFGVNLIETVNHYQQNMRSAKYALMFIALTFLVFFFVEIFTKKPIQFFQYVLVGIALVMFYSLLLSLSEQVGFGWAYLIASAATIAMTTIYFHSLIKQKNATFILAGIMLLLYAFLYIILQIEDYALLFGSIFLFIVLGVIMFVSNKIKLAGQG